MKSGAFDRRITVQSATFAPDGMGDPVPTWTTQFKRWAKKSENGMAQGEGAGSVLRETAVSWILRDDSGSRQIAPENWRIIYEGRIYVINGISEAKEGRHAYRQVLTTTRPDQRGTLAQGAV